MCFPFSGSSSSVGNWRFSVLPRENCLRIWPMLLPFLSGFLGCYERVSMNRGVLQELGQKRVRLISLLYTSVVLFVPAVISILVFEHEGDSISVTSLGWPLANTVVFGVLLSENCSDEKFVSSKDFRREFLVTFACTVVLELFYFPELSLWGLLLCGILLYFAVAELDPVYSSYAELGLESSEPFTTSIIRPIRHILSERKSRKIALFLLINTGYMVVEFVVGFMSNSLGLISDACHMLFDCAALAIGLYASYISHLPANGQFNYGRGRFEVLSGYVNAVFLVLVGALIVLESFERILDPQEISTNSLLTVSIGGLLVNVVGLIFFHEEHHHAHGGSCSHSNSHSGSHSHSQHQHDHDCDSEDQKCISVNHDCHEKSCSDHQNQHGHHHSDRHSNDNAKSAYPTSGSSSCHGHDHADIHSEGSHGCDHAHHNDHAHGHDHDHHHHDPVSAHHYSTEGHADGHLSTQTAAPHFHEHCSSISHIHQRNLPSSEGEAKKHSHHHIDHNMEGIFLHVLADTMGSVGVVVSTLLIKYKGWLVADPASSIFISILIVSSVIPLLRNSAEILLQRVPRAHEQDIFNALNNVTKIKQVRGIPHFHAWSFTNTEVVGTIHLHVETEADKASTKAQVSCMLHDVGINDLTLQVEYSAVAAVLGFISVTPCGSQKFIMNEKMQDTHQSTAGMLVFFLTFPSFLCTADATTRVDLLWLAAVTVIVTALACPLVVGMRVL
ncbi:hypothetical protein NL676_005634 [Syzygium grande]|nr:hypothetical protein NL676_005634 [Syzygium grande]